MGIIAEAKALVKPGDKFGRWTVLGSPFSVPDGRGGRDTFVVATCDCGRTNVRQQWSLRKGGSRSCGCLAADACRTHGLRDSRLYGVWSGIIGRTTRESSTRSWSRYGGRGIRVCKEWLSFAPFMKWALAHGYDMGLQIDRRDNDGDYEPGNCRWVTRSDQGRNKTNNRVIAAFGEEKLLCEWVEDVRCVVPYATLWRRLTVFRWEPEKAITKPSRAVRCGNAS